MVSAAAAMKVLSKAKKTPSHGAEVENLKRAPIRPPQKISQAKVVKKKPKKKREGSESGDTHPKRKKPASRQATLRPCYGCGKLDIGIVTPFLLVCASIHSQATLTRSTASS